MFFLNQQFMFFFLPAAILVYHLLKKLHNYAAYVLMVAINLAIYIYEEPSSYMVIFVLAALSILAGIGIEHSKGSVSRIILSVSICCIFLTLAFFKYIDMIVPVDIHFPLGISFFTFKAISYLVDIYKKKISPKYDIVKALLYLTFFPQIVSGPIERYDELFEGTDTKKIDTDLFVEGVWKFVLGFGKKVLIADSLYKIYKTVYLIPLTRASVSYVWVVSFIFSLQLYYDFSGYSDMAIGIGNMFGFKCKENFNYPYMSKSVSEFWRRWHISLGSWFRDYIYIPLGGSKVSPVRVIFNLFMVWILTGMWHGDSWNFIVWGMGHFILIVLEKKLIKPHEFKNKAAIFIYRIFAMLMVNFLWIIFSKDQLYYLVEYFKRMFGISKIEYSDINIWAYINDFKYFVIAAVIFIFPVFPKLTEYINAQDKKKKIICNSILSVVVFAIYFLSIAFLLAGSNNPFMYANF